MPKFALTYFDSADRAEAIRLAFQIGKIEFEDRRLSFEEFGAMKQQGLFKFGQVPILEVEGQQFAQSRAIMKFVGKMTGLYPQEMYQQLVVDEGLDLVEDIIQKIAAFLFSPLQGEEKIQQGQNLVNQDLPLMFGYYEKQIQKNINNQGFYGEQLSMADLFLYCVVTWVQGGALPNMKYDFEQHPQLKVLVQKIENIPEVLAWNSRQQQK